MSKKSKQKTIVAIILDKSGSMNSAREETVTGYNLEVQAAKQAAEEGQDIQVCLVTFNGDVFEHLWLQPADQLEESNYTSYTPNGNTAMYDAMGYVINKLQKTVEDDENTAYLIKTISDGEDNSSVHFTPQQFNNLREECEANGRWTFAFMGCDEASLKKVAQDTGISLQNMAAWSNKSRGRAVHAMHANVRSSQNYYAARSEGVLRSSGFYSDQLGLAANFADADPQVGSADVQVASLGFAAKSIDAQPSLNVEGKANVFSGGGKVKWNS